jgi:hypothetical protein
VFSQIEVGFYLTILIVIQNMGKIRKSLPPLNQFISHGETDKVMGTVSVTRCVNNISSIRADFAVELKASLSFS